MSSSRTSKQRGPSPRALRHAATRSEILEQAMELIATEGYEALSMPTLARRMGYVAGALYRYFDGRDALIASLQGQVLLALHEDLEAALKKARAHARRSPSVDDTSAALLEVITLLDVYRRMPEFRPPHYALISVLLGDPREIVGGSELADELTLPVFRLIAMVSTVFERAMEAGALDEEGPALTRATAAWGAIHGGMQLQKLGRFESSSSLGVDVGEAILRGLLLGWGADEARLRDAIRRVSRLKAAR